MSQRVQHTYPSADLSKPVFWTSPVPVHAMKAYGGVKWQLHSLLPSAEAAEWSASRPLRFTPREDASSTAGMGRWGPRASLEFFFGGVQNHLPLPDIHPPFLGHPCCTIPTAKGYTIPTTNHQRKRYYSYNSRAQQWRLPDVRLRFIYLLFTFLTKYVCIRDFACM